MPACTGMTETPCALQIFPKFRTLKKFANISLRPRVFAVKFKTFQIYELAGAKPEAE
jgi:hypothetical protein